MKRGFSIVVAIGSAVSACFLAGAGCSDKHTRTDTLMYADISESIYNDQLKHNVVDYRAALDNTMDSVSPDTPIEIHTFINQTSVAKMPLIYQGSPDSSDQLADKILEIYPDHPQTEGDSGTSFQALLTDIIVHCKANPNRPFRAVIVSDGGLCEPKDGKSSEAGDLHEILASEKLADKLAQMKNFKGILVLPVDPNGKDRQLLQVKVFGGMSAAGINVQIVPKDEQSAALDTFRKL